MPNSSLAASSILPVLRCMHIHSQTPSSLFSILGCIPIHSQLSSSLYSIYAHLGEGVVLDSQLELGRVERAEHGTEREDGTLAAAPLARLVLARPVSASHLEDLKRSHRNRRNGRGHSALCAIQHLELVASQAAPAVTGPGALDLFKEKQATHTHTRCPLLALFLLVLSVLRLRRPET